MMIEIPKTSIINVKVMKHRVSKTEEGKKALKALEECTSNGSRRLDMNGRENEVMQNKERDHTGGMVNRYKTWKH